MATKPKRRAPRFYEVIAGKRKRVSAEEHYRGLARDARGRFTKERFRAFPSGKDRGERTENVRAPSSVKRTAYESPAARTSLELMVPFPYKYGQANHNEDIAAGMLADAFHKLRRDVKSQGIAVAAWRATAIYRIAVKDKPAKPGEQVKPNWEVPGQGGTGQEADFDKAVIVGASYVRGIFDLENTRHKSKHRYRVEILAVGAIAIISDKRHAKGYGKERRKGGPRKPGKKGYRYKDAKKTHHKRGEFSVPRARK